MRSPIRPSWPSQPAGACRLISVRRSGRRADGYRCGWVASRRMSMNGLNWSWIAVALTAPNLAGVLVAFPLWRAGQPIFGNLAGTLVIFGSAIALIMREDVELV